MAEVNVTELRQHLPGYLKRVQAGEELCITLHGRTIARLVPAEDEAEAARRRLFALRGHCVIADVTGPLPEANWTGDADHL